MHYHHSQPSWALIHMGHIGIVGQQEEGPNRSSSVCHFDLRQIPLLCVLPVPHCLFVITLFQIKKDKFFRNHTDSHCEARLFFSYSYSQVIIKNNHQANQKHVSYTPVNQWIVMQIPDNHPETAYPMIPHRIGEASNPGPEHEQFSVGLVNPTTVLHREKAFASLDVDLLAMAETSATKVVQNQVRKNMKTRGYTTLWSNPVDNHREMLNGQESLRGVAAGVALAARIPMRSFRDAPPTEILSSSRLAFAHVQFGATPILMGVFYGLAAGNDTAQQETNRILQYAVETMLSHPGPTMLVGDFNHDLQNLPALDQLFQAGYVSILDLHKKIYDKPMPCTYQESTTRDLMIFSTELAASVTKIEVLKDREFPSHAPVIAQLSLPKGGLSKKIWPTPKNWMELQPSTELHAYTYDKITSLNLTEDFVSNLQAWSNKAELAMDEAIQLQHKLYPDQQPHSKLPKPYRGKLQNIQPKVQRFRSFTPAARIGDYEPTCEVRSIKNTQIVRQLRRIQSLRRRVQKLATYESVWPSTWEGLQVEWTAILKAKGFGKSFPHWISDNLQWPFITMTLPQFDILQALEEAVANYHQQWQKQEQLYRHDHMYIDHQIDHLYNFDRRAYAAIREPPMQFIQMLSTTWHPEVLVIDQNLDKTRFKIITGDFPQIGAICKCDESRAMVISTDVNTFQVTWMQPNIPEILLGQRIQITIESRGMQPADIHKALEDFWQPIWNRDSTEEAISTDQWTEISDLLTTIDMPTIPQDIDISSINVWKHVIQNTKSASAPGADGWYYDEIKALPPNALKELILVFNHHSFQGFPAELMKARVVPLPKKDETDSANHTRPITVLPTLYRLWSAVVAQQIMQCMTRVLPQGMIGFIKGKSGHKGMYDLAWQIEQAHYSEQTLSGLTLDLTKAFNQFPRIPVMLILQSMGIPLHLLQQWIFSLNQMEKFFDHRGWISEFRTSTTGIVEGDGLSIVGMIGVATFWMKLIENPDINPMAYADNLSWSSTNHLAHEQALRRTIRCFQLLRIPIDWKKTWVWGTHKHHRNYWKTIAKNCLPPEQDLQILHSSVDLGMVMNYSSTRKLLKIQDRLQAAITRLQKLFRSGSKNHSHSSVAESILRARDQLTRKTALS